MFNRIPKSSESTPNWSQVSVLLLYGFFIAAGGCASAAFIFAKAWSTGHDVLLDLWWVLMAVFAIGMLMLVVAFCFMVVIVVRSLIRDLRRKKEEN